MLGLLENEKCFSTLNFMKTKLKNQLGEHLNNVVHMYFQKFYIKETFPFQKKTTNWRESKPRATNVLIA
jgi:hypothetical protein